MLPNHSQFMRTRFFGSLDGLRAISILGVIWSHVWYVSGPTYYGALLRVPVLRNGAFGVSVFFGISGFLITTLLLREQQRNGRISLRDFYIRRTLRIWPLYYGVLALYVVLVLILQRGNTKEHVFFHFLPGYLTFTYTWFFGWQASGAIFNFAWSICVEEQFYLIWAGVLRILRGYFPLVLACLLISLRAFADFGILKLLVSQGSLAWRFAEGIAVPICLGAILAQALHSEQWFLRARMLLGYRWSAPFFLLLLVVTLAPAGSTLEWLCWVLACLLVAASVIREDNGLAWFLRSRLVAYIGLVSYGMYMLNTLTLDVLEPILHRLGIRHPVLQMPIAVVSVVAVAGLSYRYFESPFLGLKQRFSQLAPASAPSTVAQPLRGNGSSDSSVSEAMNPQAK
jgi:peptidoglycan/LPS O-acetylase OafA/YrhL